MENESSSETVQASPKRKKISWWMWAAMIGVLAIYEAWRKNDILVGFFYGVGGLIGVAIALALMRRFHKTD